MNAGRWWYTTYTTPVTAQFGDCLDHQVPDQDSSRQNVGGTLRTLCGEWIIPAPMTAPEGKPCEACASKIGYGAESGSRRRSVDGPRWTDPAWRVFGF